MVMTRIVAASSAGEGARRDMAGDCLIALFWIPFASIYLLIQPGTTKLNLEYLACDESKGRVAGRSLNAAVNAVQSAMSFPWRLK